jgi:hypothetical protein
MECRVDRYRCRYHPSKNAENCFQAAISALVLENFFARLKFGVKINNLHKIVSCYRFIDSIPIFSGFSRRGYETANGFQLFDQNGIIWEFGVYDSPADLTDGDRQVI